MMTDKTNSLAELETITIGEFAETMKVSRRTAYNILIKWGVGLIRAERIVRVLRADLMAAIAENKKNW